MRPLLLTLALAACFGCPLEQAVRAAGGRMRKPRTQSKSGWSSSIGVPSRERNDSELASGVSPVPLHV